MQVTVVVVGAFAIANVSEPLLPRWFADSTYVYEAVAVPAFTLFAVAQAQASDSDRPHPSPTPNTASAPHRRRQPRSSVQVTVVVVGAFAIVNVAESLLPRWFADST